MSSEWWRRSAVEIGQAIAAGETTAVAVAESHLERIAAVNGSLNAIVEVRPDEVLAEAARADADLAASGPRSALHGVPFTVKVNIDVTGYATTEGVVGFADRIAPSDAPAVEKFRAGGAVVLGRTNMPDFGLRIHTDSSLHGLTRNPWDATRTAGGSSGGEGSAIASGQSPIGLGNDIGGSVRNPAYCNGIASIKPGVSRIPAHNATSDLPRLMHQQLLLQQGVMARDIRDVRAGLQIAMGSHPRDPLAADLPLGGPALARRVALVAEPAFGTTDPEVADGVRRAGAALSDAGYEVVETEIPAFFEAMLIWSELITAGGSIFANETASLMGAGGQRFLELTGGLFPEPTHQSVQLAFAAFERAFATWNAFMLENPYIVGPVWTHRPFTHGFDIESSESALKVIETFRFVLPANLFGLPAACVPTGVINGLPTGVQVITRRYREDLALDAAQVIQDAWGIITPIDPR
jgi:amidase